ncbi:hypothetical protein [uncultured Aliivibrio sp.]|uniref:hypothetical protein n=1 Tax=uncultured Aliivibrio sp. TaxID=873085 RepID=UPI00261EB3C7|nr:hypothetical protein [uncultured Aliivibrio sp.]
MKIRKKIRTININPKVNLTGLNAIYNQALKDDEKTIVFELNQGEGCFVFMMFFDEDDSSKDKLYIYLKRTNHMLHFKMYANHKAGDFFIYITPNDIQSIKNELNIQGGIGQFDILRFFASLNSNIPQFLPFSQKLNNFKAIWKRVSPHLSGILNEADKIYFIGLRDLSKTKKNPTEKTLRKLYLYIDADSDVIKQFIVSLKKSKKTCCWTSDEHKKKPFSLMS